METQESPVLNSFDRAYAVFVNGPPRAGKDVVVKQLLRAFRELWPNAYVTPMKNARPLKNAVAAFLQLDFVTAHHYYETAAKDMIADEFFGQTPREVLINFSETWAKPLFGDDIFGRLLALQMRNKLQEHPHPTPVVFLISDTGFQTEYDAVFVDGLRPDRTAYIRLSRPGTSFHGDSRTYITPHEQAGLTAFIANAGELYDLATQVRDFSSRFLTRVRSPIHV